VQRPAALPAELDRDVRLVGSGAALYAEVFASEPGLHVDEAAPRWPDPAGGVRVALPDLLADQPAGVLAPLYLRRPDAVPPGAPKTASHVPAPSR
jgi:tRNA threonylcarbamoyladenosine biosynthesis protein TsaB